MTTFRFLRSSYALCATASLLSTSALAADNILHEGYAAAIGVSDTGRQSAEVQADFAVIPIPGGGRLNGTRLELNFASGGSGRGEGSAELDRARFQLLHWSHLRALGIERDRASGNPLELKLVGIHAPKALAGHTASRNWAIAHVGAEIDYTWLDRDFGSRLDANGPSAAVNCRVDGQAQLTDRLQLRALAEATYKALLVLSRHENENKRYAHSLSVAGGVGLYYDVTPSAPVRKVKRTNPATGEVTYRRAINEGRRLRLMLVDFSGQWKPLNSVSDFERGALIRTGLDYAF